MSHHGQVWSTEAAAWAGLEVQAAVPTALPFAQSQVSPPPGNTTFDWIGDAGQNGSGDWNTAGDWQQGSVPGPTDTARFATGDRGYTVTGTVAAIGSISVVGDGIAFDGVIAQSSGTAGTFVSATGSASVTVDANSTLFGQGTIDFATGSQLFVGGSLLTGGGTADLVVDAGATGRIVSTGALQLNDLYVQTGAIFGGDITLNDGATIGIDTSSTIDGGTITMLGGGIIYDSLTPGQATGTTMFSDSIATTHGSTLTLGSDTGATLVMSGTITGAGDLRVGLGSVEIAGSDVHTGSTSVLDGTLTLDTTDAQTNRLIVLLGEAQLNVQPDSVGNGNFTDSVVAFGTTDTIDAGTGNLLVFASQTGLFSFIGGAGIDTVVGGAGALSVTGGATGDLVFGGTGTLTFTGGSGQSTVVGNGGVVDATGGSAGDLIYGGTSGGDVLNTGAGPSTLVGGTGAQLYATGSANSVLVSGGGDTLNAAASTGNDTLYGAGAGGTDTIVSGAATSTVVLGGGVSNVSTTGTADIFAQSGVLTLDYVSGTTGGVTNVLGFNLSSDHISLTGYGDNVASQVLSSETITGGNTILQIPSGDQITLFGVTGLTIDNFT